MKKVCFFNQSSVHYRAAIYKLMDKELQCDFYFGDSRPGDILQYDNKKLDNYIGPLKNINIGPFYWQKGSISLLSKSYEYMLTPGDTYCLSTWVILLLSKIFYKNKKIYLWSHGAYGDEKWIKRQVVKLRCWLADGIFLYGNWAKKVLEQYGVPKHKLHLIYNSLDYDTQLKLRNQINDTDIYKQHFNNSNKNIIFIGRLTSVKKLDMILKAIAICANQGTGYNVTFIGDGPEKAKLQDLSTKLGIEDNVWFYGACYDEYKNAELIYNADVCVSPGNVGLTAMHTLMFGTPVITHNNFAKQMPEFEAIEDGVTGMYFSENDVLNLALTINKWFEKQFDRELVRHSCYAIMDERYNPHSQIKTLLKILK